MDPRLTEVVRYRIGKKEAHSLVVAVLEEYLNPPPPTTDITDPTGPTDPKKNADN